MKRLPIVSSVIILVALVAIGFSYVFPRGGERVVESGKTASRRGPPPYDPGPPLPQVRVMTDDAREAFDEEAKGMKPVMADDPAPANAEVLRRGEFLGVKDLIEGEASIVKSGDMLFLRIEGLSLEPAPDLEVALAASPDAAEMVSLGTLNATDGNLTYALPADIAPEELPVVLIFSSKYDMLIGYAQFKKVSRP